MQRPTGVTIIAILQFLGAGLLVLFGIVFLTGATFMRAFMPNADRGLVTVLAGLGIAGAVVCFVFAAVYLFVAISFWQLKNWARIVVLVFAILGVISAATGFLSFFFHFQVGLLVMSVIRLAISGSIAWYLLQPEAKLAFGAPA